MALISARLLAAAPSLSPSLKPGPPSRKARCGCAVIEWLSEAMLSDGCVLCTTVSPSPAEWKLSEEDAAVASLLRNHVVSPTATSAMPSQPRCWGGPLGGRSTNASIPAAVTLPDCGAAVLRLQVALLAYTEAAGRWRWGPEPVGRRGW